MCDMTHYRDSSTCVSYIKYMCVIYLWTKFMCSKWVTSHTKKHNLITFVTWLIDVTQVHVCHIFCRRNSFFLNESRHTLKDITQSHSWHDSLTWLKYMCVICQVHVCCVLRGQNLCFRNESRHTLVDTTQSHSWHDSLTWLKYMCVIF